MQRALEIRIQKHRWHTTIRCANPFPPGRVAGLGSLTWHSSPPCLLMAVAAGRARRSAFGSSASWWPRICERGFTAITSCRSCRRCPWPQQAPSGSLQAGWPPLGRRRPRSRWPSASSPRFRSSTMSSTRRLLASARMCRGASRTTRPSSTSWRTSPFLPTHAFPEPPPRASRARGRRSRGAAARTRQPAHLHRAARGWRNNHAERDEQALSRVRKPWRSTTRRARHRSAVRVARRSRPKRQHPFAVGSRQSQLSTTARAA